ncbi:MAG: M10 family metallopeptidase C-terminal domain-containing protein [Paracoccaceae bacterium]
MVTSNYEGFVFRLSGVTTGSGSTIPVGTVLDKVILTTRDLLTGATAAAQLNDGLGLSSGEGATFQINGNVITNTSPDFRAVLLNTNAGSIAALVFTVGNVSYALAAPGTNFDAATQITASSVVNASSVPVVNPLSYGLLPEGANTYTAQVFSTQDYGGPAGGLPDYSAITNATLYDNDLIRGNGEIQRTAYQETLTTVQFSDGTVLGGVETLQVGGYSGYVTAYNYLFDQAKLAASGHTIADVRGVLNSFAFDHDLNWDEAGFTITAGPPPDGGNNDTAPPPPPPPPLVVINGTTRADVLNGTAAADAIRGFDGSDKLTGNGGNDVFIFGTDSRSGRRTVDTITDFQAGHDYIGLEAGASVKSIVDNGSAIVITLIGDGDRIVINGAALNVSDIRILDNPTTFDLL